LAPLPGPPLSALAAPGAAVARQEQHRPQDGQQEHQGGTADEEQVPHVGDCHGSTLPRPGQVGEADLPEPATHQIGMAAPGQVQRRVRLVLSDDEAERGPDPQ
jgi:hypothetical protein